MARLTRKNIKVFAGNASNNGVFGSLQANNPTTTNDVEQLQALSAWDEGWNAATETSEELPPLEEMQGVTYVTTYQQAYIMQEGIPEWAATVTYYKGCLTKEATSSGFRIYNSLTDNNINHVLTDTTNWKKIMDSDDLYAFDSSVIHKTGAETVAGVKTFSASPLVPTLSSSDNSSKVANTAFVASVANGLQTQINSKANDNAVVKLTGTQEINGAKSFIEPIAVKNSGSSASALFTQKTDVEKGTAPSATRSGSVTLYDKNGTTTANKLAQAILEYRSDGTTRAGIQASSPISGSSASNSINIVGNTDGTFTTYAPANSAVNSIVTTTGISKGENCKLKLGNGFIFQEGHVTVNSSGEYVVTFLYPFTSAKSYVIVKNYQSTHSSDATDKEMSFYNLTSTTATTYCTSADTNEFSWVAIGN